jgi:transposase
MVNEKLYHGEKTTKSYQGGALMEVYAGLDLHSTNTYVAMIDGENKVLYKQRHRNDVPAILSALDPFKKDIQGVVVESTYNWYWLVDALMEAGYLVHLANVSAIKQYEGLKQVDDRRSSLWLANLLRLNILPTGYIYPKEERPTRDLLRKRLQLVRNRTSHVVSVKNILARNLGVRMKSNDIKKLRASEVRALFPDKEMRLMIMSSVGLIQHCQEEIDAIEKLIAKKVKIRKEFAKLLTVPGVGEILGLTIMLEVGHIDRFPTVGDYSSYCRCIRSIRTSNGKVTGYGNSKNGNKYLAWAYVEAANSARRWHEAIRNFYERKRAKTNKIVAIKTVSHKLARASYYVMRDAVDYDQTRFA